MFDIGVIIGLLFWAIVNYFVTHYAAKKANFMKINPILYALGAMTFGGIYPLLFLVIKYVYCSYRVNNKNKGEE